MSDDKSEQSGETQALKAEADATRARIAGRVERLQTRLQPRRLVREAVSEATSAARTETARTARIVKEQVTEVADDTLQWISENRAIVGAVAAGAGALLAYSLYERRRASVVPIYDAYAMEDPAMMNETSYGSTYDGADANEGGSRRWDRVREGAERLGARASERYEDTREAMSARYQSARDAASERYGALSEAARERYDALSDATRQRYTEASAWTRRQPDENPVGTVIAGFALGALLGALLPRTQAENRALGPTKEKLTRQAREQAQAALDAGKAKLAEAGITPDAAKAKLGELVDEAKHVAKDVAGAAAAQVKGSESGQSGGQSGGSNPGYSSGAAGFASPTSGAAASQSAASGGAQSFGTSPATPSL